MSPSLTIAALQLRAFDLADHEQAWAELLRRIDDAAAEAPRLIVAPEGSYPACVLGSRAAYEAATSLRGDAEILATLGDRARRHGCYIAAGLVLRDAFGQPQNTAVLIAPGGAVVARTAEVRPAAWCVPGNGPVTALIDDVRVALFAGRDAADGGLVAATVEGARVLIDTGAATTWGRALDRLPEPRAHVLLAARAVEQGAWGVVPGKVGVEASTRVYGGRAGIVSPAGAWVARAPSDRPGVVLHEVDLDLATGPRADVSHEASTEAAAEPARIATVAVAPTPSAVDLMEALRAVVRLAAAQGARLLVLPDLAGSDTRAVTSAESLPLLEALSAETQTLLAVALAERGAGDESRSTTKTMYLIDRGRTVAAHRQSVLGAAEREAGFAPGDAPPPVIATGLGAVGLLCGVEGLVPSIGVDLAERGATMIAWSVGDLGLPIETMARARAVEARRMVAVAGVAAPLGGGSIVDARGTVLATTVEGRAMAALTTLRD